MKNIFKLMGIAFLACGMMVACGGKDDPKDPDTPDTPDTPTDNTTSVSVTFNGTTQTNFAQIVGRYFNEYQTYAFDFFVNNSNNLSEALPGCEIYFDCTATGDYTSTAGENGGLTGNPGICEYYQNTYLVDQNQSPYGDWWAESATMKLTKLDVTNTVASFEVTATMFSALEAFTGDDPVGMSAASHTQMSVTAKNISFNIQ